MKPIIVYTPMNTTRPFYQKLTKIHHLNLDQQNQDLFDYEEEEVLLPTNFQKEGLWRGQNVCYRFNKCYQRNRDSHSFLCKWDDDMVLPADTLSTCQKIFAANPRVVGCGLFERTYGKPGILLDPTDLGWYGAFSRFYMYRMESWGTVPCETPWLEGKSPSTVGIHSGDPDNSFQIKITGQKQILNMPCIHLDHRSFSPDFHYHDYEILLNMTLYFILCR